VALNGAAHTSWLALAPTWGIGAVTLAVVYAVALSCLTVGAASFGAAYGAGDGVAGVSSDGGEGGGGGGDIGSRGGSVGTINGSDDDIVAGGGGGGGGGRGGGRRGVGEGGCLSCFGCCGLWMLLREVGARRLLAELCVDEERVGAFVAGFVWNTALLLWCGPGVVEDWRWAVAFGVTFAASAVNVFTEWAGAL